jgi:hypothetical protein
VILSVIILHTFGALRVNDNQHTHFQHNRHNCDIQHEGHSVYVSNDITLSVAVFIVMLSVIKLDMIATVTVNDTQHNHIQQNRQNCVTQYAVFIVILSVIILHMIGALRVNDAHNNPIQHNGHNCGSEHNCHSV